MNGFIRGFLSVFGFGWFEYQSPADRVKEVLDDFYDNHPNIERDDFKALQKDSETIANDFFKF